MKRRKNCPAGNKPASRRPYASKVKAAQRRLLGQLGAEGAALKRMSARLAASRETCARAKEEIVFRPSYRDPETGRFVSCSPQAKARMATAAPNPPRAGRVEIYPRIMAIEARKRPGHDNCTAQCERNRHLFRHKFTTASPIVGLPDGSILIPSNGRRLWGMF
jgi:hypothetical protein